MLCLFSNIKFKLVPVLIFALIFYSCETVKTRYIDSEKIPAEKDREFQGAVIKIDGIFLKNGKYLDMKDKNAVINFSDSSKTITYDISEKDRGSIAYDDVSTFKVSVAEGNVWGTVLIITGTVVVLAIILFMAFWKGHFNATGG